MIYFGVLHFILLQEGRSVEIWYLDTFSKLFSQDAESKITVVGTVQKYIRSTTLNHFGFDVLKTRVLPRLEEEVHKTLHSWSTQSSVDVKRAAIAINSQAFPHLYRYIC